MQEIKNDNKPTKNIFKIDACNKLMDKNEIKITFMVGYDD